MTHLLDYPFRVLIVDDEMGDWTEPMCQQLNYAAKEARLTGLQVDAAADQRGAERLLAVYHFHLVSLDMRLPERTGERIAVTTGVKLARSFSYAGFPKHLVYSQTLREEDIGQDRNDAMRVLQVPADLYAKSTGGDRNHGPGGVKVLKAREWAQLVVGSLSQDRAEVRLPPGPVASDTHRLTVAGAYLTYGPDLLPPLLARHVQDLANHWETKSPVRVDAAIRFIECTARLALAQTGAFLTSDGQQLELPEDEGIASRLKALDRWKPKIANWNWANFLTEQALRAIDAICDFLSEKGHPLMTSDPVKAWAELRVPLQYAMDIAAYWVRHPICLDLKYSRDGWNAELLAGTHEPRRRRTLPAAMDFPAEAVHGGTWQSVWRIDGADPKQTPLPWDSWLDQDQGSARPWCVPMYRKPGDKRVWLDIVTGNERTD